MQRFLVTDGTGFTSEMETCLVTGGAGFIGSHLCDYLIDQKYKVVCLDNLLTGSKKNIEHLMDNSNFELIEADVTKPINQLTLRARGSSEPWANKQINYIFHLASPASPIDYQNYSEETLLANSTGTINVLKLAKEMGAKVLITSTSEIYGDPLEHPQKETYWGNTNSFGPRSCYDESKRFGETVTYVYLKKYGIDARIIRIFNTYGPRMQKDDGRVISNFINEALTGSIISIDGDGSQTRSFCFVSDMVAGICKAMFGQNSKGEIFNLGNPDEHTIADLAEKIIKLTGSKSEIKYTGTFRQDDPMRRQPDITKAKTILGWEPVVGLDEGLQKTIEYYRSL